MLIYSVGKALAYRMCVETRKKLSKTMRVHPFSDVGCIDTPT